MSATIRWIGQGGYEIQKDGSRVVIDPYLSGVFTDEAVFKRVLPKIMEAKELSGSLVIATHDHLDHFDSEGLKPCDYDTTDFAGPDTCMAHATKIEIPESKQHPFNRGDVMDWGGIKLRAVFADHTEDSIGVRVEIAGLDLYFTGDTLYNDRLIEESGKGADVIFTCINGRMGNMNHAEAAKVAKGLGVKLAIPNHYEMFANNLADPQDFINEMDGSVIPVRILEYNVVYDLDTFLAGA